MYSASIPSNPAEHAPKGNVIKNDKIADEGIFEISYLMCGMGSIN